MASNIKSIEIARFNKLIKIRDLLKEGGFIQGLENSCYCPFHPDEMTGHKSATIKDESNVLFCFSERKSYRSYDVLRKLGKQISDYMDYDEFHSTLPSQRIEGKVTEAMFKAARSKSATLEDLADWLREQYATDKSVQTKR